MRRQILVSMATLLGTQLLLAAPGQADQRRHWFYDHYRSYEGEAFDYRAEPRVYRPRARIQFFGYPPPPPVYDPYQDEEAYAPRDRRAHPWRERRVRYDLSPALSPKAAEKLRQRRSRALAVPPKPRYKPSYEAPRTAVVTPPDAQDRLDHTSSLSRAAQEPSAKAGAVSCSEAKDIVAGFGFSNIEAKSCSGSTYSFAAKRGGKPFTIKLSSASGELTNVSRQ